MHASLFPLIPSRWLGLAGGALFPVAVGLASSFTHCAGMCGPIHLFLASKGAQGRLWQYHAGRIAGYTMLGLAAGFLGSLATGLDTPVLRSAAGWLLAGLYAFFGLQLMGWLPPALRLERQLGNLFPARLFGCLAAEGEGVSLLFPAGLMASLLPCPSTHAVLLFGMGLGNPVLSAAGMAALGVSTLPVFAVLPHLRARGTGLVARYYGGALGAVFLGLSAWRIYGAAATGTPACH